MRRSKKKIGEKKFNSTSWSYVYIYFVEGTEQQMDNTLHFDNTEESARSVGFIMSCTGSGDSLEFTKKRV